MEGKFLRFNWREYKVILKVDEDKCNMLDLVIEFEDDGKKSGAILDYKYPTFQYAYKMKHVKLLNDRDLMEMFSRLSEKTTIDIWVGTTVSPNPLYGLVLKLREEQQVVNNEAGSGNENEVEDEQGDTAKGNAFQVEDEESIDDSDYIEESEDSEEDFGQDIEDQIEEEFGQDIGDNIGEETGEENEEEIVKKDGGPGKIVFDEDHYVSDDEDRLLLEEMEDGDQRGSNVSPYFNEKTNFRDVQLVVGLKFTGHLQLKHAIKCHAVANGYVVKYLKSESTRLLAVCGYPDICNWRLWATKMSDEESFQIKTMKPVHTCVRDYNATIVTSSWLAKEYARKLRDNPTMKLKEMQADVKETYGITVTWNQCFRAKQKAVGEVEKDLEKHYALLFNYAEEIEKTNPGSRVVIDVSESDGARKFRRIYVCFAGIKRGWKENCRKIIGLDGCWLKGKCKGELLSAIGRDANDQMFPICWAVVEGESYDSWKWFLELLLIDLGQDGPFSNGIGWTIISDQQKGLIKAVAEVLPEAEHRNCSRHIYANFKKKWNGAQYRKWFWIAAKSSTKAEFGKAISSIKKLSKSAHDWLMAHDPHVWSRAFFSYATQCTNIENNMCEVFNGSILSARDKLVIFLLEDIRRALMDRLGKNLPKVLANERDPICPRIRKKLEDHKQVYRYWNLKHNGEGMFEVFIGPTCGYVVNMKECTCTCNMWQLSGIPCVHAISAIYYGNGNPDEFVHDCYKKETYRQMYSGYLQPMEGSNMWPQSSIEPVFPPVERRLPGRPKKARRKEFGEDAPTSSKASEGTFKVGKKNLKMTCSHCGGAGHNKKTCKNPPKAVIPQPKKKPGRPRVEKPATADVPKKKPAKKYQNMGAGLYIDPKTGKTYLNGYLIQSGEPPNQAGESTTAATEIMSEDAPPATQPNETD